jgi:hypothetical protein
MASCCARSSTEIVSPYDRRRIVDLKHALDEARFGSERTLNLRASLPTPQDAVRRAEAWLRERQVAGVAEVLIITGRGNSSDDGHSVVRESVAKLLRSLRRQGVVDGSAQHTAGSFVVALAPTRRLWEAPRRKKEPRRPAAPTALAPGLDPATEQLLRELATRSLHALGVHDTTAFLDREMATQFAAILRGVPDGPERDARLRDAVRRALDEDDRGGR